MSLSCSNKKSSISGELSLNSLVISSNEYPPFGDNIKGMGGMPAVLES